MAIMLNNEAVGAITELRGSPDFRRLVEQLKEIGQKYLYASVDTPVELRVEKTAFAKGVNETAEALWMAVEGKNASQYTKPRPPNSRKDYSDV